MTQKPFLNLGCGRVILPAPKPAHHGLIPDGVHDYALWHNVDRNQQPGVDEVVDVFRYPFPWADNSFDGALLTHLCEHIPHEIITTNRFAGVTWKDGQSNRPYEELPSNLANMQDGWFAFFSELYRVLTPDSSIHVLSPYAWSHGAIVDPTHTRFLTPESFMHSMQPNPDAPFAYATGGLNLEMVGGGNFNVSDRFQHLANQPELLWQAASTQINVFYEFYVRLRVIK